MVETDLNLTAEIKLYYDLDVPENLPAPAPLLLAVHGYGAHKRYMMREAKLVAPENFVIASIQAPHQHYRETNGSFKVGFGWLTDYKSAESVELHQKFALDLIENLAAKNLVDREKVYLYGFSQACALNFRLAFTHPEQICGVIGVSGGIPSDLETNEVYKDLAAEVFYLYGDDDEFYPLEKFQTFEAKLRTRLPNFQSKLYKAKHEITDEMREDVRKWIVKSEKL